MLASTVARVPDNTAEHVNEQIRRSMEERVYRLAATPPAAIDRRIAELEREWDIERTVEAHAAIVLGVGAALALLSNRRYAVIPLVVGGFLLQHALQGWYPPMPVFRRLGIRTQSEIEQERYALKALRGDFNRPPEGDSERGFTARHALEAVNS